MIDAHGTRTGLDQFVGRKVFAFCGIGNPEAFMATLASLGAKIVGRCILEDHCPYTPDLLAELCQLAKKSDAGLMVTTQKDLVKIDADDLPLPLSALAVDMEITEDRDELAQLTCR